MEPNSIYICRSVTLTSTTTLAAAIVFLLSLTSGFVAADSSSKNAHEDRKTPHKGLGSFNLNNIQMELADAAGLGGFKQVDHVQESNLRGPRNRTKSEDSQLNAKLLNEAELLSHKIRDIVNKELGFTSLQSSFDSMGYSERSPDENELVKQLSSKLKLKIKKFLSILSFNRGVVENLYRSHTTGPPIVAKQECCALPHDIFTYDELFRANISRDTACDRSAPVTSPNAFNPVKNLTQVYKRHLLRYPSIKWQYFSSEDGTHAIFPATSYTATHAKRWSCENHWDCRNQQLYATTVRPQSKNVVIVIDRGSAVSDMMLNIAKEAAMEAINTLSPDDKVSVISAGTSVQTCHSDVCFNDYMASATRQTKQQLLDFLKQVKSEQGATNHTNALLKAFKVLAKSTDLQTYNRSMTDCVIVYISAGHTGSSGEAKSVVNTVITANRKLLNRVIIMTYALVQEGRTGLEELGFLRDLAEQDNGTSFQYNDIPDLPARQKGVMTVLNQISNLPSTVGRFYTILPHDPVSKPVFSLPYIDQTGGGLIMSITQSCIISGKLIGIVGIDVNMADLLEDITYFEKGEKSYAFLINNQGYTIMHKSLARPLYVTKSPMYTDISHFESSPGFEQVRDSMMRGESGTVLLTKSRNDSTLVKYTWRPVKQAPLSVAVVLMESDFTVKYLRTFGVLPESLLYHRLDLVPADTMCAHFKQLATHDASTLMLSPGGFESPFEHLSTDETKLAVQAYMAFLNDDTDLIASPGIKSGIKNDVAATVSMENVWFNQIEDSDLNDYIVRRYVATTSGVLRMYPGSLLEKNHDPSKRPWYKAAVEQAGRISVSSPYLDVGGAGYIVTISKALYEGRNSGKHDNTDRVVGVMGIDFTLQYFYKQLQDTLPICKKKFIRCFIMDSKGYLLAHPHMVSPLGKEPIENRHITHQEVLVSNDILYHKTFVHKYQCNSYPNRTMQRFYTFNTSIEGVLTNLYHGGDCNKYRITHIKGTNAFVGVINDTCNVDTLFCPCSMVDRMCLNCKRMEQTECECPCECLLQMDPCRDKLINEEDRNPTCVAVEEPHSFPKTEEHLVQDLPQCYNSKCRDRKTYDECFGALDCEWCAYDQTGGAKLTSPYCAVQRECFNGVVGAVSPYGDEYHTSEDVTSLRSASGAHIGPVAGALLGVVMAFALVIYFYRQHVHNTARRQEMEQNISDTSVRMSQGDDAGEENDDAGNPPPPNPPYGQANIMLAAIHNPSPYHQRIRHGIRVWRRGGGTPSESDHGYSTMTPHEDSEYHYVEPEPLLVEPERRDMDRQPLQRGESSGSPRHSGSARRSGSSSSSPGRSGSPVLRKTILVDTDSSLDEVDVDDGLLKQSVPAQTVVPKIDPPPQTVLPRRTHVKAQVHMVDTFC